MYLSFGSVSSKFNMAKKEEGQNHFTKKQRAQLGRQYIIDRGQHNRSALIFLAHPPRYCKSSALFVKTQLYCTDMIEKARFFLKSLPHPEIMHN